MSLRQPALPLGLLLPVDGNGPPAPAPEGEPDADHLLGGGTVLVLVAVLVIVGLLYLRQQRGEATRGADLPRSPSFTELVRPSDVAAAAARISAARPAEQARSVLIRTSVDQDIPVLPVGQSPNTPIESPQKAPDKVEKKVVFTAHAEKPRQEVPPLQDDTSLARKAEVQPNTTSAPSVDSDVADAKRLSTKRGSLSSWYTDDDPNANTADDAVQKQESQKSVGKPTADRRTSLSDWFGYDDESQQKVNPGEAAASVDMDTDAKGRKTDVCPTLLHHQEFAMEDDDDDAEPAGDVIPTQTFSMDDDDDDDAIPMSGQRSETF